MNATLTVRYISGREERFEVEAWGGTGGKDRLETFVATPNLILQTSNELIVIPGSAVECYSFALPPDLSPTTLEGIRHAKRIGQVGPPGGRRG
jgi:hypothetical protein